MNCNAIISFLSELAVVRKVKEIILGWWLACEDLCDHINCEIEMKIYDLQKWYWRTIRPLIMSVNMIRFRYHLIVFKINMYRVRAGNFLFTIGRLFISASLWLSKESAILAKITLGSVSMPETHSYPFHFSPRSYPMGVERDMTASFTPKKNILRDEDHVLKLEEAMMLIDTHHFDPVTFKIYMDDLKVNYRAVWDEVQHTMCRKCASCVKSSKCSRSPYSITSPLYDKFAIFTHEK